MRLLAAAVAAPERAIGRLECWRRRSARVLLEDGTTPRVRCRRRRCPRCLRRRLARTPDAVAVVFEDRRAELRASSTRTPTSWRISCAGRASGPRRVVGLLVERSPEMVIGLLGILKAGGAYLPLDPGYPAERLAFMLADAAAACW